MTWQEVTDEWDQKTGGERWLRELTPTTWISVLHRLTGFGWWEWETAFVRIRDDGDPLKGARGTWDDREQIIVLGDHRQALGEMPLDEVIAWFRADGHPKNTMEQVLDAMKEASQP